jgi:hypothetical protein
MNDQKKETPVSDYLSVLQANNPSLAKYWPGMKPGVAIQTEPAVNPPVMQAEEPAPAAVPEEKPEAKGSEVKAGCIPCSLGHVGVCSSLLQEGVRFAQADGIDSTVPVDRINTCLDELNALERKDLTPELIDTLPEWEKDLALRALAASRSIRHLLESITSLDDLIHASAETTTVRKEIGREYFHKKIENMAPGEAKKVVDSVLAKIKKEQA